MPTAKWDPEGSGGTWWNHDTAADVLVQPYSKPAAAAGTLGGSLAVVLSHVEPRYYTTLPRATVELDLSGVGRHAVATGMEFVGQGLGTVCLQLRGSPVRVQAPIPPFRYGADRLFLVNCY